MLAALGVPGLKTRHLVPCNKPILQLFVLLARMSQGNSMFGSDMKKSMKLVRSGGDSNGSSKVKGGKVKSLSMVGMRLQSSCDWNRARQSCKLLTPSRKASAPKVDRLLHCPENLVNAHGTTTVAAIVSVPSEKSSLAAIGETPEK